MAKIAVTLGDYGVGRRDKPIDPARFMSDPRGLTGSEFYAISLATSLAKMGHTISMFSFVKPQFYDGVDWLPIEAWPNMKYDMAIAFNHPGYIHPSKCSLDKRFCVVTLANGLGHIINGESQDYIDEFITASECQRHFMMDFYQHLNLEKWVRSIGAPINVDMISARREQIRKVSGRIVYASSPDRGLHIVLKAWPEIKAAVPYATLHTFYGLYEWLDGMLKQDIPAWNHPMLEQQRRAIYIYETLPTLDGITNCGYVSKSRMVDEMCEAEVLAFPCSSIEYDPILKKGCADTQPLTILESSCAGAKAVVSDAPCIPALYSEVATIVPSLDLSTAYAPAVIEAMQTNTKEEQQRISDWASNFGIDHMARLWQELLAEYE